MPKLSTVPVPSEDLDTALVWLDFSFSTGFSKPRADLLVVHSMSKAG